MKYIAGAIALSLASLFLVSAAHADDCESGYYVANKSDDGSIIKLDNGATFKIDDTVDSELWLEMEDITVCDEGGNIYKIINTDDDPVSVAEGQLIDGSI